MTSAPCRLLPIDRTLYGLFRTDITDKDGESVWSSVMGRPGEPVSDYCP